MADEVKKEKREEPERSGRPTITMTATPEGFFDFINRLHEMSCPHEANFVYEGKDGPDTLPTTPPIGASSKDLPHTLMLKTTFPEGATMSVKPPNRPRKNIKLISGSVIVRTNFSFDKDGFHFKLGDKPSFVKIDEIAEHYKPGMTIEDLLAEAGDKPSGAEPNIPQNLPQQTFEEMRVFGYSLADTDTLRFWSPSEDGASYIYERPKERFQVKFDPSALPEIWSGPKPDTEDSMRKLLKERGWKGMLTAHLAVNCALTVPDEPIALDEFVSRLFDIRSAKQRNEKRVWVWETLCTIFNMRLYGLRAGSYKDPETKKTLDLEFRGEPLIAPSPGTRSYPHGQQSLWPDDIPVTVGFTMGKWGKEARKNPKVLQYFGELKAVLDIPGGKLSGAWAQCILVNLNQKWREGAKAVKVNTHKRPNALGKERKVLTARWGHDFTRRELLIEGFPPGQEFSVEDILNGPNPQRARNAWNEAIRILKRKGHVTYCKELEPLDSRRKGWANDWLDQPLDIRPGTEGIKAAEEILAGQKKALSARKRKPKGKGKA